jgi:hypothetical protein
MGVMPSLSLTEVPGICPTAGADVVVGGAAVPQASISDSKSTARASNVLDKENPRKALVIKDPLDKHRR